MYTYISANSSGRGGGVKALADAKYTIFFEVYKSYFSPNILIKNDIYILLTVLS